MTETQTILKASELRLGNWVYFDVGDFPRQVTLESFAILFKYPERLSWIKPIELTPEILEKAGFRETPFGTLQKSVTDYLGFSIKERWDEGYSLITESGVYYDSNLKLLYLHQLQNLFYSLCGEELKINL